VTGSSSLSRSISDVFGADVYRSLFGTALDATDRAVSKTPGLQSTAASLFSSGSRFLEELGGPTATEGRLSDAGVEDEQIAALGDDLGRFFAEEINPAIASRGIAAGQFGGSRGEVAKGIASGELSREFVRGSTAIRAAGVERRDRLAGQVDATKGSRIGQSFAAIPGLFGLAEAGASAELAPLLQLAGILGDRTVLTQSEGSSVSSGQSTSATDSGSFASQLAKAFSASEGQSTSESTSQGSTLTRGPGLLDIFNVAAKFFSPGAG